MLCISLAKIIKNKIKKQKDEMRKKILGQHPKGATVQFDKFR
jgi:hypothetical protein